MQVTFYILKWFYHWFECKRHHHHRQHRRHPRHIRANIKNPLYTILQDKITYAHEKKTVFPVIEFAFKPSFKSSKIKRFMSMLAAPKEPFNADDDYDEGMSKYYICIYM